MATYNSSLISSACNRKRSAVTAGCEAVRGIEPVTEVSPPSNNSTAGRHIGATQRPCSEQRGIRTAFDTALSSDSLRLGVTRGNICHPVEQGAADEMRVVMRREHASQSGLGRTRLERTRKLRIPRVRNTCKSAGEGSAISNAHKPPYLNQMRRSNLTATKGKRVVSKLPASDNQPANDAKFVEPTNFPSASLLVDVKATRNKLKMTQEQFADAFGLSVSSIRNWEQGTRKPERPVALYLRLIDRFPDQVMQEVSTLKPD